MPQFDPSYSKYLDFEHLEIGEFKVDYQNAEIRIALYNLGIFSNHPKYADLKDSLATGH
mgnify:CR=1 FL=1